MIGLGTIINSAAIAGGGMAGHFTGKLFNQDQQNALNTTCGISVIFIAIAGAMQGMLAIDGKTLVSGKSMLVVLCLAIAYLSLIGSILIFCVGLNLVWGKKVRVANMLPAVFLAIIAAYLPWSL